MITTIHPSPHTVTVFFLVVRTFKICSLSNFQICNRVLWTTVAVLYITSPGLIYFTPGSLLLWPPAPILPTVPESHLQQLSIFSLWAWFFFFMILYISEIIQYLSFPDSFYLAWCLFVLSQMARFPSLLWLSNVPLYTCTSFSFFLISFLNWFVALYVSCVQCYISTSGHSTARLPLKV